VSWKRPAFTLQTPEKHPVSGLEIIASGQNIGGCPNEMAKLIRRVRIKSMGALMDPEHRE
jgi:hypothetical protein